MQKEKWMKKGFIQVPRNIMGMTNVSWNEKIVLGVLMDKMRRSKSAGCSLQQEVIAQEAGVSVKTVRRAIYKWRDMGFIVWVRVNARTYYYLIDSQLRGAENIKIE